MVAFERCKEALVMPPVLVLPNVTSPSPSVVYSDASDVASGAVLSQVPEGEQFDVRAAYQPIAFSKSFKPSERKNIQLLNVN